jgi:hypothetical protein
LYEVYVDDQQAAKLALLLEQSTNHLKFEGARQQQNCHGIDLSLFFLQTNPSLHFMLKVRQFIEMVSGQDTATDEDSTAIIRLDPTEKNLCCY